MNEGWCKTKKETSVLRKPAVPLWYSKPGLKWFMESSGTSRPNISGTAILVLGIDYGFTLEGQKAAESSKVFLTAMEATACLFSEFEVPGTTDLLAAVSAWLQ